MKTYKILILSMIFTILITCSYAQEVDEEKIKKAKEIVEAMNKNIESFVKEKPQSKEEFLFLLENVFKRGYDAGWIFDDALKDTVIASAKKFEVDLKEEGYDWILKKEPSKFPGFILNRWTFLILFLLIASIFLLRFKHRRKLKKLANFKWLRDMLRGTPLLKRFMKELKEEEKLFENIDSSLKEKKDLINKNKENAGIIGSINDENISRLWDGKKITENEKESHKLLTKRWLKKDVKKIEVVNQNIRDKLNFIYDFRKHLPEEENEIIENIKIRQDKINEFGGEIIKIQKNIEDAEELEKLKELKILIDNFKKEIEIEKKGLERNIFPELGKIIGFVIDFNHLLNEGEKWVKEEDKLLTILSSRKVKLLSTKALKKIRGGIVLCSNEKVNALANEQEALGKMLEEKEKLEKIREWLKIIEHTNKKLAKEGIDKSLSLAIKKVRKKEERLLIDATEPLQVWKFSKEGKIQKTKDIENMEELYQRLHKKENIDDVSMIFLLCKDDYSPKLKGEGAQFFINAVENAKKVRQYHGQKLNDLGYWIAEKIRNKELGNTIGNMDPGIIDSRELDKKRERILKLIKLYYGH